MLSRETFARMHDKYLEPPDEGPECECCDAEGDEVEHEECKEKDCPCPLHEKYNHRNEPEYNED